MTNKIFKIALNNIIKHKRRTFFNSFTFAMTALSLITVIGMVNGMYNSMYERAIDIDTGHFKIYNKEYIKEKKKMPLDKSIKDAYGVIDAIKGVSHFEAAAPRIVKNGMLSNMKNKTMIMITGIDMEMETQVTKIFENLDKSYYLEKKDGSILLGKRLGELLGNGVGDSMLLYGQTALKANNLIDVQVQGIYNLGFNQMEKMIIFMPFKSAQAFFDMEGRATEIIVRIDAKKNVHVVQKELEAILSQKYPELELRTWKQEAAALVAGAKADYTSYAVIFMILLFLSTFIVMNTLTINVFERTAEIGTLRAIGLERGDIGWMFMWEGLILSIGGAIIGGILALPTAYYMSHYGFQMSEAIRENMPFPIESMTSIHHYSDWIITTVICMITGVIGAVVPSRRAAKTDIVDALKKGVR